MGVKKRPLSTDNGSRISTKRADSYDSNSLLSAFKSLGRKRPGIQQVIRKSSVFVPITDTDIQFYQHSKLANEIKEDTLQFVHHQDGLAYICIQDFSALELALALGFILGNKGKRWFAKENKDSMVVPRKVPLRGSFYIHKTCKVNQKTNDIPDGITISKYIQLNDFIEISIEQYGVGPLMDAIIKLSIGMVFRKSPAQVNCEFSNSLRESKLRSQIAMTTVPFLDKNLLIDEDELFKSNGPALQKSQDLLNAYVNSLREYNEAIPTLEKGDKNASRASPQPVVTKKAPAPASTSRYSGTRSVGQSTSRYGMPNGGSAGNNNGRTLNPQSRSLTSNYLTQEQVKEYSIATVKASIEAVQSKSPYQILKTYIKFPRHDYIDLLYDKLHDMRQETNCNVVVMNLNNVHESTSWFDSLDVAKHMENAKITSVPHPSTVRVVSIGGIGEHNVKALRLLLDVLNTKV
ncbi:LADA_0D06326g1_1 [Lachancea dasiensis]|uniref:LADA_0D06326g1_1 n=1 Tax=Lachancea dasiensis TaxID=1072105 RepID=A0A1G4J5W3_9SACH|nr:LADA_0D06326g1_1 [Lachancea dasiensis]